MHGVIAQSSYEVRVIKLEVQLIRNETFFPCETQPSFLKQSKITTTLLYFIGNNGKLPCCSKLPQDCPAIASFVHELLSLAHYLLSFEKCARLRKWVGVICSTMWSLTLHFVLGPYEQSFRESL